MVDDLGAVYPDLVVTVENDQVIVAGPFPLMDGPVELDRYHISVELPLDFPDGVPILREVGGRIPPDPDHHVNPDGTACLFVSGERWLHWPRGSSFSQFLEGPVRSHLIGQALTELGQQWPYGERTHGARGVLEAYGDMLGEEDQDTIARYVRVLARTKLRRHRNCPCGSGRPLRDCHLTQVLILRKDITPGEAEAAQEQIRSEFPALTPGAPRAASNRGVRRAVRRFHTPRRH
jgi:hypothetical protein